MKLLVYSQASTVQPMKFENGSVISSHRLLGMWLFIHVSKRVPISRWYLVTGMLRCVCCKHFGENLFCCYCTESLDQPQCYSVIFYKLNQEGLGIWLVHGHQSSTLHIWWLGNLCTVPEWGCVALDTFFIKKNVCLFEIDRSNIERHWDGYDMGQVTELRLSCYLVLLSIDGKTR